MSMPKTITIRQYLTQKEIEFWEANDELITRCVFSDCDDDSREKEGHLSFNAKTGQYCCYKCGAIGNIITLARHLGDDPRDVIINEPKPKVGRTRKKIDEKTVEDCHKAMPVRIREYLNGRGISNDVIDQHKLGYGGFYEKSWITIPIKDLDGSYKFFKLRQDPNDGNEKMMFPEGEAQIYDWDMVKVAQDKLIVCEGELDRLALLSVGVSAVTSTHGANTFKDLWAKHFPKEAGIYICYDNDHAGRLGSERVAGMFHKAGYEKVFRITLPEEVGEKGDITDYLVKLKGQVEDLFTKYATPYPEPIDYSDFKPLSSKDLVETLGLTIKHDDVNKTVVFLCALSTYTEESQLNVSFNGPSSTGKSFIPLENAKLFPPEDIIDLAHASPTAFFHDAVFDADAKCSRMDLERKHLIFLDQPNPQLLERLRPFLSHDKKELTLKITDKTQKYGMKTKTIVVRGYPSAIFCTAALRVDDQEATRFILLSPETSQEKIRHAIHQTIGRAADPQQFQAHLEGNLSRQLLRKRILAIKREGIQYINLEAPERIEEIFLQRYKTLKPKHQRDIKRVIALTKAFALLNLWWRSRVGTTIIANNEDVDEAFMIWDYISAAQEHNLPPFVFEFFNDVIVALWNEKNTDICAECELTGLSRREILQQHFKVYGRLMNAYHFRQEILPLLEASGLIYEEPDPNDKRSKLIYVTDLKRKSSLEDIV